jgi:hypothetical protein
MCSAKRAKYNELAEADSLRKAARLQSEQEVATALSESNGDGCAVAHSERVPTLIEATGDSVQTTPQNQRLDLDPSAAQPSTADALSSEEPACTVQKEEGNLASPKRQTIDVDEDGWPIYPGSRATPQETELTEGAEEEETIFLVTSPRKEMGADVEDWRQRYVAACEYLRSHPGFMTF